MLDEERARIKKQKAAKAAAVKPAVTSGGLGALLDAAFKRNNNQK